MALPTLTGASFALVVAAAACLPVGGAPDASDTGELVVLGPTGNLATMTGDGRSVAALTTEADARLRVSQPTWSPDGTHIAWSELDLRSGSPAPAVVVADRDGSLVARAPTAAPAFYLSWDPEGGSVAYLSAGPEGIELGLVDPQREEARPLAGGEPFYFSWGPGGDRMVTHVGDDRLSVLSRSGEETVLLRGSGSFRAPVWLRERDLLLYSVRTGDGEELVVSDPSGDVRTRLAEYRGAISFLADPLEQRVAVYVLPRPTAPEGEGVPAALASPVEPGRLTVVDVDGGEATEVAAVPVAAFSWSPDGGSLLFLEVGRPQGTAAVRWRVWEGGEAAAFDWFLPTAVLARDYLPFFDQYAQSISFWSPDGGAFAYPGIHDDGDERVSGVWVQRLAPSPTRELVSEGSFGTWSPRR